MTASNTRLVSRFAIGLTIFALASLGAPTVQAQQSQQLIQNGNFETGDFTGFTLANQHNPFDTANADHFYISTPGANTPAVNGVTFATAPNPNGGNFYAVSTSDFPGAHALLQDFVVPSMTNTLALSFQMFVNDQSGVGPTGGQYGLDYMTGGNTDPNTGAPYDNQHARVDILKAGASDLSTDAADIVATLYGPDVDPSTFDSNGNLIPNPYKNYSFDLTGILFSGQSYRLRFAEVDNLSAINLGVDNINLVTNVPVPELGAVSHFAILGLLFTSAVLKFRRTR